MLEVFVSNKTPETKEISIDEIEQTEKYRVICAQKTLEALVKKHKLQVTNGRNWGDLVTATIAVKDTVAKEIRDKENAVIMPLSALLSSVLSSHMVTVDFSFGLKAENMLAHLVALQKQRKLSVVSQASADECCLTRTPPQKN
jgi:hypothetical protein